MTSMFARAMVAAVLVAGAVLPGIAGAGEGCRAVSDALGDHAGNAGIQLPGGDPRAGGAVDLTGLAIYPAGWGDLIVQLGVADVEAPLHPLADADRYAVVWEYDGRTFTIEALRSEMGWSYTAWARPSHPSLDPEAIEDRTYPLEGTVDAHADTITMVLSALALEGPAGPRTLTGVHATAEEVRRLGMESASAGTHALAAAYADRAPDTASGATTIDLDIACGPDGWAGATPMCRTADDPEGDVGEPAALLAGEGREALDLTGVFVASDAARLILEVGVVRLTGATEGTAAAYGVSLDVDGRTIIAEASRAGLDWRYEARFAGNDPGSLPVAGSVSVDRIRFEIPADLVRAAFTGRPMRAFEAWSRVLLDPGIAIAADRAPDAGPDPAGYTLGGPCTGG